MKTQKKEHILPESNKELLVVADDSDVSPCVSNAIETTAKRNEYNAMMLATGRERNQKWSYLPAVLCQHCKRGMMWLAAKLGKNLVKREKNTPSISILAARRPSKVQ